MSRHQLNFWSALSCTVCLLLNHFANAADMYDAALTHAGRPAADSARDALDHPADMLRLAGIKPGMKVADVLAGDGYYSELASYIVGPSGHVFLINNKAFDDWSQPALKDRLAADRLTNVTHQIVDLYAMNLPAASLDAVLLIKVYHDMYWVDSISPVAEDRCRQRSGPMASGVLLLRERRGTENRTPVNRRMLSPSRILPLTGSRSGDQRSAANRTTRGI